MRNTKCGEIIGGILGLIIGMLLVIYVVNPIIDWLKEDKKMANNADIIIEVENGVVTNVFAKLGELESGISGIFSRTDKELVVEILDRDNQKVATDPYEIAYLHNLEERTKELIEIY